MPKTNPKFEDADEEYRNYLRHVLEQAWREKWNTQETSMAVQALRFSVEMKWADMKNKGGC
jgi:hypothetical protein